MKSVREKIIPKGNRKLFEEHEWVPTAELTGEKNVLTSPLLHEAFNRIVNQHVPVQKTAFLSLCTATRPYYNSKKWKKYIAEFKNKVDMIVVSNGGMMPEEFWESYPYLNYDAGDHEDDDLYISVMYDRMLEFFKNNKYEYVLANFSHKQRNSIAAEQSLSELKRDGYIKDYVLIPSKELYEKAQSDGWLEGPGRNGAGLMYPDLHKFIFLKLVSQIEHWGYNKSIILEKTPLANLFEW
jgi:hypothetical protein